jgi:hypothetical protein
VLGAISKATAVLENIQFDHDQAIEVIDKMQDQKQQEAELGELLQGDEEGVEEELNELMEQMTLEAEGELEPRLP